jgi:molybdenum cofactor cytidylyltransferase
VTPRAGRVGAVVLAAGEGRRVGSPKALLPLAGATLVEHLVREVRAVVDDTVVVSGAEGDRVDALAAGAGALPVRNPRWREGMTSSVQAGVAALPQPIGAFLILPVDHVFTTRDDVTRLIAAWSAAADPELVIARPVHGGSFGHPVLFGAGHARAFLELESGVPARDVYRRHRARVVLVEVENPRIRFDLDTPEDLELARRILG